MCVTIFLDNHTEVPQWPNSQRQRFMAFQEVQYDRNSNYNISVCTQYLEFKHVCFLLREGNKGHHFLREVDKRRCGKRGVNCVAPCYSGTRMSHTACCYSWLLLFSRVHDEQYPVVMSQVLLVYLFVLRDMRIKGKGRWRRRQKEIWFNYRTPCVVSTSGLKWSAAHR